MENNEGLKRRIRVQMRERRRALSDEEQRRHALAVRDVVAGTAQFRDSGNVACYWAVDGEVSLLPLIELCRELGKSVYLPVIQPSSGMVFRLYSEGERMVSNRYGIPEPPSSSAEADLSSLDIVLAPLVSFSAGGNRLGVGGGYYDRAFSDRSRNCWLVGVAHSCQRSDDIPVDSWDVPLDAVVTEVGLRRAGQLP